MKKPWYVFTLLMVSISSHAQINLDSLLNIWYDTSKADTIRLDAIKDLSENYWNSNPDSALVLAGMMLDLATAKDLKRYQADAFMLQAGPYFIKGDIEKSIETVTQCLDLSKDIGYSWGIARAYSGLGVSYIGQGNLQKSLEYQNRALVIAEEMAAKSKNGERVLGETKFITMTGLLGGINTWLGIVYSNMDLFVKAIESFERALKYQEADRKKAAIAGTLNNIANIYMQSGDTTMARDYFERSFKIAEEVGSNYVMAADLQNLGIISMMTKDYQTALDYYTRASKLSEEAGDQFRIGQSMRAIANVHLEMKNYPKAIEYLDQASAIFKSMGAASQNAEMLTQRGFVFLKQGNYNKAIRWCKDGLTKAEEIQTIGQKLGACDCLYQAYRAANQNSKALEYHERLIILEDSLDMGETGKKLQQMEFAKQILADSLVQEEEKLKVAMAHQSEVNQKDKTRNVLLGSGFLVLLMAGGLWNRLNFTRKSKATLQVEKDRSENLLLNILPSEVAEELKLNGTALARDFELVSIIFTDFKGFTETSAKL
ncbi:MAG: tetratricopeptide repeat protein, partial [Saprospiraceae bacterium]|nr:tetratricopeptide repeat protein [Saprospiraceae bacterium]